ncbi:putative GTP cyclohydrolase-2 [Venturia nashicola]|uniref:Putative GTP cyclohydrolase-2 n=1 Tax=Venturia nashicola TaxID=86259 RepID=A0A4Z1NF40_9PEZI|nr:putative GTP cyclohydrolase-2 [Venturia nashicola]TLD15079.1 putative GTP cyclohydrolase-2 [Venturia nashicola]
MRSALALLTCISLSLAQSVEPLAQIIISGNEILLKLDYATYRGYHNTTNEVYTFRNIRFAAPPIGELRWQKPVFPGNVSEVQDRQEPIACTQPPSDDVRTVGGAVVGKGSEDCLFLDLTIPEKVVKGDKKERIPVLIWVHGGYYAQGSKDERSFHQFAKLSDSNIVSIAANYRIGAYGFLGGSTVGGQGIQNVGLWDQRAAFEWVQQYIPYVGGNINRVTAMGISAGAGSILHHITAEGGALNPLFQTAILQSAGYATVQDTTGAVERKYSRIEEFAGCKNKGLACLRALDEEALRKVSVFANSGNRQGDSGWDPVIDGIYVVNTPTLEIAKGRFYKDITSIVSGYAINEAGGKWFVDQSINTSAKFDEYARSVFGNRISPGLAKLSGRLQELYPAVEKPGSPFKTTNERVAHFVADIGFNCHHRALAQAYPTSTYTYQASLWGGTHYMDQFPSFFDPAGVGVNLILKSTTSDVPSLQAFQTYLVSAIVTGDPNTLRNKDKTIEWPITAGFNDTALKGVLNFTSPTGPGGFSVIASDRLVKERCDFWNEVWTEVDQALIFGT